MGLEYNLFDTGYMPSTKVDQAIQQDIGRINESSIKKEIEEKGPAVYLAFGERFEKRVDTDNARLLAIVPGGQKIYYSNGATIISYNLRKPLEELTEEELKESIRGSKLLIPERVKRLWEIVANR